MDHLALAWQGEVSDGLVTTGDTSRLALCCGEMPLKEAQPEGITVPNYLLEDCPRARAFLASIKRTPTDLSPFILIWLSDEEVAQAKAMGLKVIDDLTGQEV